MSAGADVKAASDMEISMPWRMAQATGVMANSRCHDRTTKPAAPVHRVGAVFLTGGGRQALGKAGDAFGGY